ncbi:MAG: hypothetical protein DME26_20300, partial [Verrucomicrobia bacterium]
MFWDCETFSLFAVAWFTDNLFVFMAVIANPAEDQPALGRLLVSMRATRKAIISRNAPGFDSAAVEIAGQARRVMSLFSGLLMLAMVSSYDAVAAESTPQFTVVDLG